jgi:hypothetical protein
VKAARYPASTPVWVQLLPTGLSPEGLLAIPSRDLFLTSDEVSGTITIFEGVEGIWQGSAAAPTVRSSGVDEPWAALSGLAASSDNANVLYAVPDNAAPSAIYEIQTGGDVANLSVMAQITSEDEQAYYDLEGIAVDTSTLAPEEGAGFWLAHEGNAAVRRGGLQPQHAGAGRRSRRGALRYHVARRGRLNRGQPDSQQWLRGRHALGRRSVSTRGNPARVRG